ncbi:protein ECERIFERUM 3 [Canna indica]|uniref:aldehyde oxygenase (deformylating) n=1 Tax=Canna indica TaxID=4628 RepID=A0AAQ3Q437_9LILI|nr:protein ECERIFERUM 3 [Canna indica]
MADLQGRRRLLADRPDNFLILQFCVAAAACSVFPSLQSLPLWDAHRAIVVLFLHADFSEPVFYWVHRTLHGDFFFPHYHALHHSSRVPQSFTEGFATPLEHLILVGVMGAPLMGACLLGRGSAAHVYGYVLGFDLMRCMGNNNMEGALDGGLDVPHSNKFAGFKKDEKQLECP